MRKAGKFGKRFWGACWGREGLSRPQRSLLNLGMLAALNRPHEFELHFRAVIGNGLSRAMLCCGVPAGVEAFRIVSKVLAEPGVSIK